jgi:Recombination endonuclease VII
MNSIDKRIARLRYKSRNKPKPALKAKPHTRRNLIEKMKASDPLCSICREFFKGSKDMHLDHDHETNKLRGLLCHNCNVGLGHFKDKIVLLESAIDYLKKWKMH